VGGPWRAGARARGDGAVVERVFPSGLEYVLKIVAHPVGGVGVEAAHAGDLVAEALLGEDPGMPSSAIQVLCPC
jgi:hypothetical protein